MAGDAGLTREEEAMTVISDIARYRQMWPDAVVDIGPIELTDHHWGIVGLIPYDGHVVLAVIGSTLDGAEQDRKGSS